LKIIGDNEDIKTPNHRVEPTPKAVRLNGDLRVSGKSDKNKW